jgi:ABC-type antimicrobial peptide transport system permease subunit
MALGAQKNDILRMVLTQGVRITMIGLAFGFAFSILASRLLDGILYQVPAIDPLVYGVLLALLGTTAMLAAYIPARRATNVEPLQALRQE